MQLDTEEEGEEEEEEEEEETQGMKLSNKTYGPAQCKVDDVRFNGQSHTNRYTTGWVFPTTWCPLLLLLLPKHPHPDPRRHKTITNTPPRRFVRCVSWVSLAAELGPFSWARRLRRQKASGGEPRFTECAAGFTDAGTWKQGCTNTHRARVVYRNH